jgi:beta-lactamase regulating signal transducer with metallopeptidase domain
MTVTRAWVDAASSASADWLVRTSWQAGVLIVALVAIQLVLGHKRLAPRWAYALWMLVVVRLLMPAVPQSPWSVFNLKAPSWAREMREASPAREHRVAEATRPRVDDSRLPQGTRVTVGIIDGPERHVTSSVVLPTANASHVASAPVSSTQSVNWKQALAIVWIGGAGIAIARVLAVLLASRRRIRKGAAADTKTLDLLDRCRREMGMGERTAPRIVLTDAVSGPALFGFVRPVLLVPPKLLRELSREELRFVLLHELAHLRRRDPLANALLVLASAVHWFNPLVRFALARLRAERELACDELVMSRVEHSPATAGPAESYGQAVLRVAQTLRPSRRTRRVPVAAVGMIHTRSQLRRRIAMIATYTPPAVTGRRSSRLPRVALPVLLVLLVASCALTDGATKPAAKAADKPAPETGAAKSDAPSAGPASPSIPANAEPAGHTDATMQSVLDRNLPELKFDGQPFSDVMNFLRDVSNVNLVVDWRGLEAAGIDRNTPITENVHNIPFAKALQIVLDDAGGGTTKLGYTIDGNILKVTTQEEISKNTVTRVYDIRDLLVEIPDFENPRHANTPAPQTRPADPAKRRADHIEQICDLIKESVDVDSWRENGGSVGSMRELDGQLIVTQTEVNHRDLAKLLEQLREPRSLQVVVETRFVTLDPTALDDSLRQKLAPSFETQVGKPGVSFLTDDDVQALLRASNQSKESTIVTAPRLTLFSGQRAYVTVATQRAYVSSYSLEREHDGKSRWEPNISVTEAGVEVDVSATVSADRKNVMLTLRPELTRLVALRDEPFKGPADAPKDLFVQVPQVTAQRLQTSASVPDRQTLLLGGVVADVDATGQPSTRPTGNLYILVKPTLLAQREVAAK